MVILVIVGIFAGGVLVGAAIMALKNIASKDPEPEPEDEPPPDDGVVDVTGPGIIAEVVEVLETQQWPPVGGWPLRPPKHSQELRETTTRELKKRNTGLCQCPPTPAGSSGLNRGHLPDCVVLHGYLKNQTDTS